ncbi:MAG TPA: periplasmic nitrate reductase subunit alpha [Sutterella sp.]|nr:periplasmic nitrate reductase subunit alpha [Sutterella sp.]
MQTCAANISRRSLIKSGVAASTALAVGIPITPIAANAAQEADKGITWTKGVCRFCGTGCGLQVGTMNGQIVATKGDPDAPVNRGLNCIKGYFNAKILYGKDRLNQPLMRKKNGKFDKNGRFEPVSWKEAMDEIEKQFRRVYQAKGPTGVSFIGSGQYTIPEAYTVSKMLKAGFRSHNIDPNARLCMASAVVGFYQTFGVDEPSNCYDDIEIANTMVLWGNNMAEAHPVLWSRVTNTKLTKKETRIFNVTTHSNLSSGLSDVEIIFKPNTDLAILNYLAREIIKRKAYDKKFIDDHCIFATGVVDIGYGMRPTDKFAFEAEKDTQAKQNKIVLTKAEAIGQHRPEMEGKVVEQKNQGNNGAHWHITFDEYCKGLEPYTLDFVAPLAKGDPDEPLDEFKKKLKMLADFYCDPKKDILSFWCMGGNQHVRGVWMNEQVYALHLLTAKQARPGNGAFSLTGQPSACGSAREVGAFSHRLPADLLVANPKHREKTEKIWNVPAGTINPKLGKPLMGLMRGLEDGSVNFMWTQVVNVFQSAPNANHWLKAARKPENFIVVADAYPTLSAKVADVILPAAMIFEKWGLYGNAERRTQGWTQMVEPVGQARTDIAMMFELCKRFKIKECWCEQKVGDITLPNVIEAGKAMGYDPEMSLYDALFANMKTAKETPWPDPKYPGKHCSTAEEMGLDWFPEKALFNEYRQFTLGGHDLADFDTYMDPKVHGLTWPVVDGKPTKYRFNAKFDPFVKNGDFEFYGPLMKAIPSGNLKGVTDKTPKPLPGRAKIFFRPFAEPVEKTDKKYDLMLCTGRILEHWHTGTMTRRVPELHRAAPHAVLYMNPKDAEDRGIKRNDLVEITSRRGSIKSRVETQGRMKMHRGFCWMAFFDESVQVNKLCVDATDPISGEPDYKKNAVFVKKI